MAPPTSVMNSRRLIAAPWAQDQELYSFEQELWKRPKSASHPNFDDRLMFAPGHERRPCNGRWPCPFPLCPVGDRDRVALQYVAKGLGRVETLGRSTAIEQVSHSRPFEVLTLQAHFNFEVEHKNIILIELWDFEFPHRLGHFRTHAPQQRLVIR